jgi:NAD(P)-dependent dehydrogenase (short-subunit alcohol dehydrogenase family)
MGRAAVHRFAEEGAHVIIGDFNEAAAQTVVDEIVAAGGKGQAEQIDASSPAALKALFEKIGAEHGVLHALHNQVGMAGAPGIDIPEEIFDKNIAVNLKSAFYATTYAWDLLQKAGGKGSITYLASTGGLIASGSAIYSLTKSALVGYVRTVAVVGGKVGIRANVVAPGTVDTPMLPTFFRGVPEADIPAAIAAYVSQNALNRAASPEEIGATIAFLNSDDAGFITGVTLPVDGGLIIK